MTGGEKRLAGRRAGLAYASRGRMPEILAPSAAIEVEETAANTITAAAQGPAAAPRRAAGEANSRRSAVDVAPGKSAPEKVGAGGKDCNAPMPSSQGGHIAGTAANLAPCAIPPRGVPAGASWGFDEHRSLAEAAAADRVHRWLVYYADEPTQAAGSLTEARALAGRGNPRYAEIASLDTGRHLMRFKGSWAETRPAGSAVYR